MHFYSWKEGLKTGIYYLRRKAKHQAQQFTIEPEQLQGKTEKDREIAESLESHLRSGRSQYEPCSEEPSDELLIILTPFRVQLVHAPALYEKLQRSAANEVDA